jgi:hypothetical protein
MALHALDFQEEDGGWCAWRGDKLVPTALFVLFLSRSRESDLALPLPRYEGGPVTTGPGADPEASRRMLVADPDGEGKYLYGPEVLASLEEVSTTSRLRLAREVLEVAGDAEKAAYVPILVRVHERGTGSSRSLARKTLEEITGIEEASPAAWLQWHRKRQTQNAAQAPPSVPQGPARDRSGAP